MIEEHNENNKINHSLLKVVIPIIIFVLIILIVISSIKIIIWIKENKQNKKIIDNISNLISINDNVEEADKYKINFDALKQINNETIAWIKVDGTNIEYPIVKTNNNDFYLTHDFNKNYNNAGWIFMDYTNIFDGSDKNIVIYGHNRKDGSMFGTLKNIFKEEWLNNNYNFTIPFVTENKKEEYKVFSIYRVEKEDYYITTNFSNKEDYKKFLETIKARSIKDFNIDVTDKDQILTLSTCDNNNRYRVVLHAKKIK